MMDLPGSWAVAPLEDLVAPDGIFTDGDWVESKDQDPDGDVRLIQLADIADGRFLDKSSRFLTSRKADELNCTFLRKGMLPASWLWLTAESVGTVQLGRQRSPRNRSNHFPTKYIRAANLTEDGLALDDLLDMEFLPHELSTYRLEEGDLLVSEASGSAGQVGKAAIWEGQVPNCCFQNTVIRHRAFCGDFAVYLLWMYRYFYTSGKFAQVAGGVGINHLSVSRFAQMQLPICSPAEQAEIVRILSARLEAVNTLQAELDINLTRAEALRQSILKQTFSGRLVPQDPDDEPAGLLLQRIRAKNASQARKRRRPGARRR